VDKRRNAKGIDVSPLIPPGGHASDTFDANAGIFLRGHLQLHGYLLEQADEIEKYAFFNLECIFFFLLCILV